MILTPEALDYLRFQSEMGGEEFFFPEPWSKAPPASNPNRVVTAVIKNAVNQVSPSLPIAGEVHNLGPEPDSKSMFEDLGKRLAAELNPKKKTAIPLDTAPTGSTILIPAFANFNEYWKALDEAKLLKSPPLKASGRPTASLAVVSMEPLSQDTDGKLLCNGPEGELLGKMLKAIQLERDDTYCTTLLKGHGLKANLSQRVVARYAAFLVRELELTGARFVLFLGEDMAQAALKLGHSLDTFRENQGRAWQNWSAFFTFLPQDLLIKQELKKLAWSDLQKLQRAMAGL